MQLRIWQDTALEDASMPRQIEETTGNVLNRPAVRTAAGRGEWQ